MKPTLVTGANGHVGYNLCRLLRERGEPVRGMIRPSADPTPIEALGVEIVRGDVLDRASLDAAVAGAGRVYHAAAGFLLWSKDPEREIVAASRDGTRHMLEAAAAAGVERVLYVSTSGTVGSGETPHEVRDESHDNARPHTHYFVGKIAAEREAFAISERTGMPVVAVNPSLILGPRFFKPSESVRQVVDFVNQGVPVYFDGGSGVVDVEDVARGAMLAMEKGGVRERHLLSSEDLTVKEMLDVLSELTGLPGPKIKLPIPVLRIVAGGIEIVSRATGARPMIDRSQIDDFAGKYSYYSNEKSKRELGMTYRSARDALRRTVAWVIDQGFVAEKRRARLVPHPSLADAY